MWILKQRTIKFDHYVFFLVKKNFYIEFAKIKKMKKKLV